MQSPHAILNFRGMFAAIALLCSFSAHAQLTYTVNSTLDEVDSNINDGICQTAAGTCTLRAAVMQANRVPGGGATIILPASPTPFGLTRVSGVGDEDSWGDLDFSTPDVGNPIITVRGAGAGLTTIDANQIDRVLQVKPSRTASISDVTVRGGLLGSGLGGAGIYNAGSLTLSRVVITNNTYLFALGGGILNEGTLAVFDSTIIGNRADVGAGICTFSGGSTTVDRSMIAQNAARRGGGLFSSGPTVIRSSLITNNSAQDGAGIFLGSSTLSFLTNTTVSGNFANTNGGGIYVILGTVNLNNVSVINNDADHDRDQVGGIGGGVFVVPGAVLGLRNSLIADNTVLGFFDDDCNGVLTGYGRNMLRTTQGCSSNLAALSLITGASVGPLQNNGGPTLTHALLAGSQAIDASLTSDPCQDQNGLLSTDQRGSPRVVGVRCDIGAFEYALDPIFNSGFE